MTTDQYYVAVVGQCFEWFDGPFTAEEAIGRQAAYNADPTRNAVVIGRR